MILSIACCLGAAQDTAQGTALSDSISISGVGNVVYPELGNYNVVLPTAGGLDFLLDPLGLLSLKPGQSAPIDALSGGIIVHPGDARIINNSSHSVKVSVRLRAESTDGGYEGGAVATFLGYSVDDETTISAVRADGSFENNILLYVVTSAVNLADQETPFIPADKGYVITTEPITLEFILPGAEYDVTEVPDGEPAGIAMPGTGSGVGFRIGGYVNTNADWSDFRAAHQPSTVTVYASYTITKESDADPDARETPVVATPTMLPPETADALSLVSGQ